MSAPAPYLVGTRLTRQTAEFGPVECDIAIYFDVASFTPGSPATWTDPAEPAEYEFEIVSVEFDSGEPDDAPGPLTAAEIAEMREWFDSHAEEAEDAADGYAADQEWARADDAHDRRNDEIMMGERT